MLVSITSAILGKGAVFLVNILSIPLVSRYLNGEEFGFWLTASTGLALFLSFDLGIANALTNLISEAYAEQDNEKAGRAVTAAFWLMIAVASVFGLICFSLWPRIPWQSLFHLSNPVETRAIANASAAAMVVFLVGLPASLAAKILGGYQELPASNLFSGVGSIFGVLVLIAICRFRLGLTALTVCSAGAVVGANLFCLLWIFTRHKPWLRPSLGRFERGSANRLLSTGGAMFLLQLSGIIVFNSDNFVIVHYLGPIDVIPYNVTWRLVGFATALQTVITPALWPSYAEAFVRGDLRWLRRSFALIIASTVGIVLLVSAGLLIFGKKIILLWAGPQAVPTQLLLGLMCFWIVLSTYMSNTSILLLATNKVRAQAWLSTAAAALNLAASIYLVQRIGSVGVLLSTIASYLLLLVVPQTWTAWNILRTPIPVDVPARDMS
jgi:O-antigen/teichoic acid export membrane protein